MADRKPRKIRTLSYESVQRVSSEALRNQRAVPPAKQYLRFWQSGPVTSTTGASSSNSIVQIPHTAPVSFSHICIRDGGTVGSPSLSARIYTGLPKGDARDIVMKALTPVANLAEDNSSSFWLGSFGDSFTLELQSFYFLYLAPSGSVTLTMTHPSTSPLPGNFSPTPGLPDSFVFSQGRTNFVASELPYFILFGDSFWPYFNSFDTP